MKKLFTTLFVMLLWAGSSLAQISTYTFAGSSGTFTAITGGTVLYSGAFDDDVSALTNIGFTFNYNGTGYTQFGLNANGWFCLGSTAVNSYTPISGGTSNNVISALGADLQGVAGTGEIRYQVLGTSPNQTLVVQWLHVGKYLSAGTTDDFSFQIRLNETSNTINFVYGSFIPNATSGTFEVGLRGPSNSDFNNRTTTSNWASTTAGATNNATCTVSNTVFPASGQTFTFSPPVAGTPDPPTNPNPANAAINVPVNGSVTWTFGANTVTYDLKFGPTGSMVQVVTGAAAGATGSYTYSSLTYGAGYQWQVIEHNAALTTNGPIWSFSTVCGSISAFPWSENFDAMVTIGLNIFPACWLATSGSGTPWYSGNAASTTYNDPCSAPNYAYVSWSPSATDKFLITPGFSLTAGTIYVFSFNWVGDGYAGWTGDVLVNTAQTGAGASVLGSSFVVAGTTTAAVCTPATRTFVPAVTGTYYFMVRVNNSSVPYYLGFDDFSVTITPPCSTPPAQPTLLVLTPSTTSMNGSFTAAASTDKYLVVRSLNSSLSASPVNGTVYTVGSSLGGGIVDYYGAATTFTSTGLTPSTLYYYYIFSANDLLCAGVPSYLTTNPLTGNQSTLTMIPISGTKTIGPTGDFFTLTAAFQYLNANGVNGPLNLVLQSTYLSSVEPAFPVPALIIPGASSTNKVTVYPSATGLSITSNSATGTINLDGAKYVYFDGRVNATGSTKDLVIENSTTGYAIQLVNGASNNGIQYCIVKGANTTGTNGTITFAGTTGTTGNSNNLIDNCEIRDGVSNPLYAVASAGSATPSAYNSNNTVSNCLIHDFYYPGGALGSAIAIYLTAGCTSWTIDNNSFYQTTAKSPTVGTGFQVVVIAAGDGYTITNNFIGGSAPNCGGAPWTLNGNGTPPTIANFMYCIRFFSGLTINPSLIQGNTISNILLYTNPAAASIYFTGFLSTIGIQNISNNVIGSATGTGSITISVGNGAFATTYEGIDFRGMYGNVTNNTFGSFTVGGAAGSASTSVVTVRPISVTPTVQNGTVSVSGNLVGSLTTANSIQASAMTNPPVQMQGFFISSTGSGTMSVANNTVANISNLSSYSTSHIVGIYSAGTGLPNVLNGNTIRDLTTTSTSTTIAGIASVDGIYSLNSVPGSVIRSNNIYNLTNTTATAAVGAHGIYVGHTAGTLLAEKNFIHNIGLSTTSATAQVNGIYMNAAGAYCTFKNNMIQLGINPDGTSNTSGCIINGMYEAGATVDSVLNNSIYIGGAPAAGATGSTYAFNSVLTPSLSTPRVCLNNIFFNTRSGGTTGKHYGIKIAGTTIFPLGVTSNYNLIIANGATGGTFGYFNSLDQATFAAYKGATNTEMASGNADPNFVAPTGNSSTADLHVASPTPIEGAGIALSSVADDFDGTPRSGLTPPDVGADAGNFTLSADIFSPNITYVPIGNGTTTNRVLTNWATITDNVGVSTGANLPRIYFKKSTDNDAFGGNTSADNGWKYASASNSSSPFSFTIDYSIIFGGSVAAGNIIQYFVVAQDAANNLSSNYLMAGSSGTPPVQNINAKPTNVQSYTIVANTIPTTITLPGTYANLTGAGGAFDMINQGVLTGNTTINITGDLTEPGTFALNVWAEDVPGANYTLLIKPDATTLRTISGSAVTSLTAMIRTNGASRLTIDGGAGKYLTFRNTNSTAGNTGPTIQFNGGSQSVFLKNCTIENNGTGTTYGAVNIGSTGTNIVEISGNDIRDATGGTLGRLATGIYNGTFTNSVKVLNNNIYNFINYGLYFSTVANGAIITGNSFYYNSATASTAAQYCVYLIGSTNNHTISNNYFGGQAPLCAGTAWTNSSATTIYGIYATLGIVTPTTISNNTIQNFNLTNTGSASFYGMYITAGVVNILNNLVGSPSVLTSIASAGTGSFYGIYAVTSATAMNSVQGNTLSGLSYTNTASTGSVYGMYLTTGLFKIGTISPNIIGSNTTAGSITYAGTGSLFGIMLTSTNPGNAIENNIIGNWSLTGTAGSPILRGLYIYSANVRKNKVFNLLFANTGMTPTIYGIHNYGASGVTNEYSNNLVSLTGGNATNPIIYGFYDGSYSASIYNLYFNDFYISGAATGTSNTYAYYRSIAAFYTLNNNIFTNTRAAGGTGKHYAIYVSSTGAWNSNYNDVYSAVGPLGFYNAADQLTMTSWKTATGGDANSQNVDPQFASVIDLRTCKQELNGAGIAIPGITTDYAGVVRANPPDIGAYEFSYPSPTIAGSDPVCEGTTGVIYTTQNGMSGYTWTISAGGSITGGLGTYQATVTWNTPGPQTISVNYANANGCYALASTVFPVTVTAMPTASISYAGNPFCKSVVGSQPVTLTGTNAYTGGTYSAVPGGLSLNASTGDITPSTSTEGTYTVTYTIPASGGCPAIPVTTSATITAVPTAVISYAGTPFCTSLTAPQPVTLTGTGAYTGGIYSVAPAGLTINATTGDVTPSTSTAGTYTVTYTIPASGGCASVPVTTSVTITTLPTAVISYAGNPFCKSIVGSQPVTLTGTDAYTGGTYTAAPVGLTINASTGDITPSTSTAGTYTVTYTIPASGGCAAIPVITSVTITDVPTAVISYAGTPFCTSLTAPQPVTLTGSGAYTGGVYSSAPAGLTINAVTGDITPSTSTAGTYTVTYTILASGGCAAVPVTTSVTITTLPTAVISYTGNPYCKSVVGSQPVTLTGTDAYTGGTYSAAPAGLTIDPVTGAITPSSSTEGTYTITYTIPASGGCGAIPVTTSVTITAVPTGIISYAGSPFCTSVVTPQPVTLTGTGAYTGGTYAAAPAGLTINATTGDIMPSTSAAGIYTVTYTIPASGGCAAVPVTTSVTITTLPTAAISYAGNPFCKSVVGSQPVTLTGTDAYAGGTYSAVPAGLTIDPVTGAITPSTSTAGIYTVTYTIPASGGCAAIPVTTSVTITDVPTAVISYAGSPYCKSVITPQPVTLTGTGAYTGGIYSAAPAGLTINASTGDITPSTSTAGTYTVTYTIPASGGCAAVPVTTSVTITTLPTAVISYAGNPFCKSIIGSQPVTLTGTDAYLGGTFTAAPAGLTINAATGDITPSTSTAGIYTVTYTIPASGGCAAVPVTTSVTITDVPTAAISYAGNPFCKSVVGSIPVTLTGTGAYTGGTYAAAPAGLTINAATGDITPSTSAAGIYTITYTIPASGGCAAVPVTTSVTITAVPTATISYIGNPFCQSVAIPQAVTLTGTGAYAGGTFSAAPAGLTIDPVSGAITPSTSATGTYTVTYIIPASGGCAAVPVTTSVTINPLPDPTITGPAAVCASPIVLNYYYTQPGKTNYQWNVSAGVVPMLGGGLTDDYIAVILNVPGAEWVSVNYTDLGCSAASAKVFNILVKTVVTPTLTGSTVVCEGTTGVTYTTDAGMLNYLWSLSFGGTITGGSGTEVITVTWNTAGAQTVTVDYTDPAGCPSIPKTINVLVKPTPPVPVISGPGLVCKNSAGIIYSTQPGMTNYFWTISGGTITAGDGTNTVTVTWITSGTQSVAVNYDLNGCYPVTPTSYTVVVVPLPTPTVSGNINVCEGTTGVVYTTEGGNFNYFWTVSAGGVITSPINTNTITVDWISAGSRFVTVTYSNVFGCYPVAPTTYPVTVHPLPVPLVAGANPVCAGSTGVVYTTDAGKSNYAWTMVTPGGTITSPTNTYSILVTWNTPGLQTISVTYTDEYGCNPLTPTYYNVMVTAMPTATISYAGNPFCKSVIGSIPVTLTGTNAYLGGTFTAAPPGLTLDAFTGAIIPSASAAGLYTVTYTIPASGGCAAVPVTTSVTITAVPTATISYIGNPFCQSVVGPQAVTLAGTGAYTGGTYSAVPAGLTLDPVTGAITPSTSTAGTYTVTYTIPASGGCAAVPVTTSVTITAVPTAVISYAGTPYCTSIATPQPVTITGTGAYLGGTYTASPAGLSLDPVTGAVTPSTSTAGTYTVTYTIPASGGCIAVAVTTSVTITALPTAAINYIGNPFCKSVVGPQPVTLTGTNAYLGGTFTAAPAGLTLDPVTGDVTPSTSAAGLYTVTYTIPASGGCAAIPVTTSVTITAVPTANISYAGTPFCKSVITPQPVTLTGTGAYLGGTYTASPAGLTLDAVTGDITPSTSAAGLYTVTYTIPASGGCAAVPVTTSVTITAVPTAVISYAGSPFCKSVTTPQPVTLTGTGAYTGGTYTASPAGLTLNASTGDITPSTSAAGLYTVTYTIPASGGCAAVPVTTSVTITAVPTANISYAGNPFCKSVVGSQPVTLTGTGAYLGGTFTALPAGLTLDPVTGAVTPSTSTAGLYTVTYTIPASGGCAAVPVTTSVTITAVPTAAISYAGTPFCKSVTTPQPVTLTGTGAYLGGTFTALPAGLTLNAATGAITPSTSTAGTYTVTYTIPASGGCAAVPVTTSVTITAVPTAAISYAGNPFCKSVVGSIPVTLTGTNAYLGGTFTASPAGLTLDAVTGAITPSSSTAGIYTVTYTIPASGGCGTVPVTTSVTITAVPTAVITYAGTPFCTSVTTPQPVTLTGTGAYTGGTYTASPVGLTLNAATGAITPSTSTPGTYTVTYTIPASGGCAAVPVTTSVVITALPTAAISYAGNPFCKSITAPQPVTLTGTNAYLGGTFTAAPPGLTINAVTGAITPSTSAAGTYTVTYTIPASGGCGTVPVTTSVTINALPVPNIIGYTSMCVNVTPLLYETEPGMNNYAWAVSSGGTISGSQNGYQVWIIWTAPGAQWVSVTYTNQQGCTAAAPTTLNVFVEPLPDPAGAITGNAAVCGGTTWPYSVGAIANTLTYVWTLPAGATIATGAGTNSITVDFGPFASSGNITVYGNNLCGNGASSPPLYVNVTPLPDTAGVISGDTAVCVGVSGVIYSVAPIANAATYAWTVPAGASIVAGGTTNSITVDFTLNAVPGLITVYGTNSCGNGQMGPEFFVNVYPIPPTPIVTVINDIILHSNVPTGNLWYYQGAPAPLPNTGQDYTATQSGEYWCVVTWNDCSSDTSNHVWIVMPGIQPEPSPATFVVYPVPNDGRFTASITSPTSEIFTIKVYNNLGVVISETRNIEVNRTAERYIDLRPAPTGVYTVVFESGDKHVIRKILINR